MYTEDVKFAIENVRSVLGASEAKSIIDDGFLKEVLMVTDAANLWVNDQESGERFDGLRNNLTDIKIYLQDIESTMGRLIDNAEDVQCMVSDAESEVRDAEDYLDAAGA